MITWVCHDGVPPQDVLACFSSYLGLLREPKGKGGEFVKRQLVEDYGKLSVDGRGHEFVRKEVLVFFKDHPFLLVSEERLAALLCRPLDMVAAAVRSLEHDGFLTRKDEETLLCSEDYMSEVK